MNILVTGAKGFIGKNLIAALSTITDHTVFEYDVEDSFDVLDKYTKTCDFVFHLAGVNRPTDDKDFTIVNTGFTKTLLDSLRQNRNTSPVVITSSIQAELDNPYGESKRAAEMLVFKHSERMGSPAYVYRLPNVFGKWCRPNYNSAVATFCHNTANRLTVTVNDPETVLNLVYIDDVVAEFMQALKGMADRCGQYCSVKPVHTVKLGEVAALIESFRDSRRTLQIPDMSDPFTRKLYSTYLSYLPGDDFSYPLTMHKKDNGSFTEFMRTNERGQVSVNISKPGITKGNHWHHTKNEKFLVVSGKGIIRFRRLDCGVISADHGDIIEYKVCGDDLTVVDIPPGYAHNIENTGSTDMVTIMWANECFDPEHTDTYPMEV